MKTKRYLQGILMACCLLIAACAQMIVVNADEQEVSLEIELAEEGTPMEGVIFSMYRITDGITAPEGQALKFMPDFEDCGYETAVTTARELVALSRRLTIWIEEHDIQPTYILATDVTGRCSISSVPFGMYLIIPSSFDEYGPVVSSLVFLPGRDENGDLIYHNRIVPKHSIPEEDNPDGPSTPAQSNTTIPEETTTPQEESTPDISTSPEESRSPEEESSPYETTGPAAPTTPSSPAETTTVAPTTAVPTTTAPESPRRILGIEDPSGRIGMLMVTAGVALMAIAIVLLVRRELKK